MKKKKGKSGASKKTKEEAKEAPKEEPKEEAPEPATADEPESTETTTEKPSNANDNDEAVDEKPEEAPADDPKSEDASSSETPSLAQQSKLRSTSFRAASGAGPLSPSPFSPDGETAPEIYRKNVARIEELEKENKRLEKEAADSEKRWQKAEEELADLREADGDATSGGDEQLVSFIILRDRKYF
jgi:hypothetical protein